MQTDITFPLEADLSVHYDIDAEEPESQDCPGSPLTCNINKVMYCNVDILCYLTVESIEAIEQVILDEGDWDDKL